MKKEYTRMDFYKELWRAMSITEKILLVVCIIGLITNLTRGLLE
jgi:hypothetical protein